MTRPIKFRCWDKENKEMISEVIVSETGKAAYAYYSGISEYKDAVLMQFTGLLDKNGKEIYEGDLIKFWSNENISVVKWHEQHAKFDLEGGHMNGPDLLKSEVIGNIYENPELLK